jgi:hypothetical protein
VESAAQPKVTAVCAAAWRVAAELLRRHPSARLRVWQDHTGMSVAGRLGISVGWPIGGDGYPRWIVNVGGNAGEHEIEGAGGEGECLGNLVHQFLANAPFDVVNEVERRLGLPRVNRLPVSTPAALVARLIAGFLEARVFSRGCYRTTFAYADTSAVGPMFAAWAPVPTSEAGVLRSDPAGAFRRLGRHVLLHECTRDGEPVFESNGLRSSAVMFDLPSGKGATVGRDGAGASRRLLDEYAAQGRLLEPLSGWIARAVGSPFRSVATETEE